MESSEYSEDYANARKVAILTSNSIENYRDFDFYAVKLTNRSKKGIVENSSSRTIKFTLKDLKP